MSLKGKRILITAGPTWVPIDSVRVVSNIATGMTGMLLAGKALVQGARVTLVLGGGRSPLPKVTRAHDQSMRIVHFHFFNELKDILKHELKNNKYDIVIHSAAVSDFYPVRKKSPEGKRLSNGVKPKYKTKRKLNSDRAQNLKLVPLEKLVFLIRRFARRAKLVIFKLETAVTDRILVQRAKSAREEVGANLVVANRLIPYRAFIIDKDDNKIEAQSKQELAKKLIKLLSLT